MTSFRQKAFEVLQFNVFSFAVRLGTSAVVARVMGPEAMGLWLLLTLLPTYAEGFGRLKVDLAAVYLLGQRRASLGEVSTALNVIALSTGGVIALLLIIAEKPITARLFTDHPIDPILYRLTVLAIPLHFLSLGYGYLLLHFEDIRAYNAQSFLRTVLPSLLAACLLLLTPLRIGALVSSLLVGGVLGLLFGAWTVHKRERPRLRVPRNLYAELLLFARRLYLAGVIEHLNLYMASLLVGVRLSTRELAFFRLGQDRLQLLDQIPASVNTLLYPRIAKMATGEAPADLVSVSMRIMVVVMGACSILGAVLAPAAVWILYGRDFLPMVWSLWLLLPGVCALGVTSPATQFFMGSGRPDYVWKLALIPLTLQAVTIVPAMRIGGFRGAACAMSVSFIVCSAARVAVLGRCTGRTPVHLLVPRRADVLTVLDFTRDRMRRVWAFGLRGPRSGADSGD